MEGMTGCVARGEGAGNAAGCPPDANSSLPLKHKSHARFCPSAAGQGGQKASNGEQIGHQSFDSSGNKGLRQCMRTGTPVRLWAKVCGRNRLLDRPGRPTGYRYVYFGLFKVR